MNAKRVRDDAESSQEQRRRELEAGKDRPTEIFFRQELNGATAKATLYWDKAPKTCSAIVSMLPFSTVAWHGTMSGAEALCVTPRNVDGIPRDESENCEMGGTRACIIHTNRASPARLSRSVGGLRVVFTRRWPPGFESHM